VGSSRPPKHTRTMHGHHEMASDADSENTVGSPLTPRWVTRRSFGSRTSGEPCATRDIRSSITSMFRNVTHTVADRVAACLKGMATGDAIGKQTETLSHQITGPYEDCDPLDEHNVLNEYTRTYIATRASKPVRRV
jgi:hypothetical protein